ncbi:helix-turn-helix domain-containing GNAT family N-acetyltransferase [bacterium]|nr:helix-turn-helix domain-containing GNAT family N-acetyltransferase [bacterium]
MKSLSDRVEAVRRFNRFYTRRIGVVTNRYLNMPFSLAEARVIFELFSFGKMTATELRTELSLDAGYLSRILQRFEKRNLLKRQRSDTDGRRMVLCLTEEGQKAYNLLNQHSRSGIEEMLNSVPLDDQQRLITLMETIEELLSPGSKRQTPYLLRFHQPGDMGWVIRQHGMLYHHEYDWDIRFEALVAEIAGNFINNYNPKTERCWIAEKDGENIGSVFLVQYSPTIAKLRMLLVTPKARGLGVGTRLVDECIRFARQTGYKKIRLWTVSILAAARKIYENKGFQLVKEEAVHNFGQDLIDETWELKL